MECSDDVCTEVVKLEEEILAFSRNQANQFNPVNPGPGPRISRPSDGM